MEAYISINRVNFRDKAFQQKEKMPFEGNKTEKTYFGKKTQQNLSNFKNIRINEGNMGTKWVICPKNSPKTAKTGILRLIKGENDHPKPLLFKFFGSENQKNIKGSLCLFQGASI